MGRRNKKQQAAYLKRKKTQQAPYLKGISSKNKQFIYYCVICRSAPSTVCDIPQMKEAEERFNVYKKLQSSFEFTNAESTAKECQFCCEICFESVSHLHNLQVKLVEVQTKIKAIVTTINNSIKTETPASLDWGKDCGLETAGRQNRSGSADGERENESSMAGDEDVIKITKIIIGEIKIEDEIEQEILEEETNHHDHDNFIMKQDVYQSRARGSPVLEKEVRRQKSKSVAVGKAVGNTIIGCYFCSKKFLNSTTLLSHISRHTLEQPYKCKICEVRFTQPYNRNRHVRVLHENIKRFECTIKNCSFRTYHKGRLAEHMRSHTKEKPFKCDLCELSFGRSSDRTRHINSVHKKLKPYKCTEMGCSSRFSLSSDLRRHINAVHKGLKPFVCTVHDCSYRCANKGSLITHMLVHLTEIKRSKYVLHQILNKKLESSKV